MYQGIRNTVSMVYYRMKLFFPDVNWADLLGFQEKPFLQKVVVQESPHPLHQ